MPIDLRQSTASQEVPLGYFVDSTDGDTEETGLTIANTDIKIWKNGATTLANKNSGGGTHISNGIYYAVLDATDSNTIGPMVIFVHVSGALAVRVECRVLAAAQYDFLYGTAAPMASYTQPTGFLAATFPSGTVANTTNITAGTITTTTNLTNLPTIPANWLTAAGIASGAFTSAKFAAGAFDAVWTVTTRELTAFSTSLALSVWHVLESAVVTASTMGLKVKNNLDAAITSRMASYTQPTGFLSATFPTTVASTTNITGGTITTVTNLTNAPTSGDLTSTMKASVNTEVDTALADYDPPTRAELTTDTNSVLSKLLKYVQLLVRKDAAIATDNSTEVTAINADGGSGAGAFANTADSQEAIRDRGDASWLTAAGFSTHSAADVWAVGTRVLTAGTNIVLAKGTGVTGFNDLSAAQVNAEADTAIADAALATAANLATVAGYLDTEMAATLAAAQDIQAKLGTPSDFGSGTSTIAANLQDMADDGTATYDRATDSLQAIRDSAISAAGLVDAMWDEPTSGHATAGTTGKALIDAGSAGDPWSTALPGAYGSGTAGKIVGDNINATISSRSTQTSVDDLPTNSELDTALSAADDAVLAAIAALNNLSAAQVNAEVDTALADYDPPTKAELDTAAGAVVVASAGISAASFAAAALNSIADALLDRNMATGTDSGTDDSSVRTVRQALRALRNKVTIAAGTATVTKENDSTPSWTAAVTTTAGDPISGVDPT